MSIRSVWVQTAKSAGGGKLSDSQSLDMGVSPEKKLEELETRVTCVETLEDRLDQVLLRLGIPDSNSKTQQRIYSTSEGGGVAGGATSIVAPSRSRLGDTGLSKGIRNTELLRTSGTEQRGELGNTSLSDDLAIADADLSRTSGTWQGSGKNIQLPRESARGLPRERLLNPPGGFDPCCQVNAWQNFVDAGSSNALDRVHFLNGNTTINSDIVDRTSLTNYQDEKFYGSNSNHQFPDYRQTRRKYPVTPRRDILSRSSSDSRNDDEELRRSNYYRPHDRNDNHLTYQYSKVSHNYIARNQRRNARKTEERRITGRHAMSYHNLNSDTTHQQRRDEGLPTPRRGMFARLSSDSSDSDDYESYCNSRDPLRRAPPLYQHTEFRDELPRGPIEPEYSFALGKETSSPKRFTIATAEDVERDFVGYGEFDETLSIVTDEQLSEIDRTDISQHSGTVCYNCGELGYTSRFCTADRQVVCHICEKKGHVNADCPLRLENSIDKPETGAIGPPNDHDIRVDIAATIESEPTGLREYLKLITSDLTTELSRDTGTSIDYTGLKPPDRTDETIQSLPNPVQAKLGVRATRPSAPVLTSTTDISTARTFNTGSDARNLEDAEQTESSSRSACQSPQNRFPQQNSNSNEASENPTSPIRQCKFDRDTERSNMGIQETRLGQTAYERARNFRIPWAEQKKN